MAHEHHHGKRLLRGGAVTEARASIAIDKRNRFTMSSALEVLRKFVQAAGNLNTQWPEDGALDEGYPESLPSFDELADQLETWLTKVESRPGS
jgi:hypothetical protein